MLRGNRLWPGHHHLVGKQSGGPLSPDKAVISLCKTCSQTAALFLLAAAAVRVQKANEMNVSLMARSALLFEGGKAGKKLCASHP